VPACPTAEAAPDTGRGRQAAPLERISSGGARDASVLAREAASLLGEAAFGDCSNLTAAGVPLELGFVWPQNDMRLTVDPMPGGSAQERSASCVAATAGTLTNLQSDTAGRLRLWQRDHSARYGAWLGLRARGGDIRRKLYLDVPQTAPWQPWEAEIVGKPAVLPSRGIVPTMAGLDGDRGGVELYYRAQGLHPAELDTLLARAGLPPRGVEIARTVQELLQRTIRGPLPSADMGFSYALDESGRALAFTWYSTSRALLGPPSRAREAILRVVRAQGWDAGDYERLTGDADTPHHGIVGMTIPREGPMQLTATVAAVPGELRHA
jgi:hypothetical protein